MLAELFLGNDLLAWLVLALGGALVVGNGLALVRPPDRPVGGPGDRAGDDDRDRDGDRDAGPRSGDLARAPIARTVVMMIVGLVAAVWAVATLTS